MQKKRRIVHAHQSAKIYQNYYKPSLNLVRLLKSVLTVVISGNAAAATVHPRRK